MRVCALLILFDWWPILSGVMVLNGQVLVNDDSRTDLGAWLRELKGLDATLVLSPNLHEIRAYNRLAKLSVGSVLVFAQDDDAPAARGWLHRGIRLLSAHQGLGLLGGYRGRMDYGKVF
jgi:hypothetical protein